jgi:hypothetical protein
MTIDDLVRGPWAGPDDDLHRLGHLLRSEGVNLIEANGSLGRGTPVYVEKGADLVQVQRLMCRHHIRTVPVLEGAEVVGSLDVVDLARHADSGS